MAQEKPLIGTIEARTAKTVKAQTMQQMLYH
jgi:hypothetical protein